MTQNDYVIGLLLVLIVLSAIPIFAQGVTWFALLLLLVTWSSVLKKKGAF